ncbi:MAG: hypothetical protein HY688_02795 [Chloroflexi bacterium]|nr:hypothetical protein [Chloroflexota bacterium]
MVRRSNPLSLGRLLRDPVWWAIVAAGVLHTALHYATYLPAGREALRGVPYFNLHAIHEAEFLAVIAFAAYRYRALGGSILIALTAAASVPYALSPYILESTPVAAAEAPPQFDEYGEPISLVGSLTRPSGAPRPSQARDRVLEVVIILGVGAFVTLLGELRARDRERREQALAQAEASNHRLTALHEVGQVLARAPTISEAPVAAARAVVSHLGQGSAAAVYLFSADADAFLLGGRDGLPTEAAQAMNLLPAAAVQDALGAETSRSFSLTALPRSVAPLGQALQGQGFASCLLVPLRVQEEWLGLLVAAFRPASVPA